MIWLRWFVRRALHMLDWQGIAGIALLVVSVALYASSVSPLYMHLAQLKNDTPSEYDRQRELKRIAAEQDPAAQLEKFHQHFVNDEPLTDWLGKLYGIGDAYRLTLRQAEYRVSDERGLRLIQYQIIVPVTATYPQLKQFIAAVLTEAPIVSLDQLTLQRRKVGDTTVDAQLQFTLYLAEKS